MSMSGVTVDVKPKELEFAAVGEKKSFTVSFTAAKSQPSGTVGFGRLVWSDGGKHSVACPIAVTWT
jgi:hypothetical protein